jgi:3-methyladenine DNA glycosylase AlkD
MRPADSAINARMSPTRPRSAIARSTATARTVAEALAWLERRGSKKNREGMARYGIRPKKAYGVSMATMRGLQRKLGKDHALALALFRSGWHEARLLACLIDEPGRVTAAQMDRWAQTFDNWAVCDSTCFHLFDRTPHAWRKVRQWARNDREFVKRAAFALLAGLAVHDKQAPDAAFVKVLPLVLSAARDERNVVVKAVNWALRSIGKRSVALNAAAIDVARRLVASEAAAPRWVGRDALRELTNTDVKRRITKRKALGRAR